MTSIMILCLWLLSSPAAYVACRWLNRVMGITKWTRMDRVTAIFFALFYGPVMIVIVAAVALLEKVGDSAWANRDARW